MSKLVLASKSPRRQELLRGLGLEFSVVPSGLIEPGREEGEPPPTYALRLARLKSEDVWKRGSNDAWVLGADTIVVLEDEIIGKPRGHEDAVAMLKKITGRMHTVFTGCWIIGPKGSQRDQGLGFTVESNVWLAPVPEPLIRSYVLTGEPLDKAGSYAIQGKGAFMVERIHGSYTNVVGLPLVEVVAVLLENGVIGPSHG